MEKIFRKMDKFFSGNWSIAVLDDQGQKNVKQSQLCKAIISAAIPDDYRTDKKGSRKKFQKP